MLGRHAIEYKDVQGSNLGVAWREVWPALIYALSFCNKTLLMAEHNRSLTVIMCNL